MSKIFSTQFHKGSYIDKVSGAIGQNSNGSFERTEKGMAWRGNGSDSEILYPNDIVLSGDFSIVTNFRYRKTSAHRSILGHDVGVDYLSIRDSDRIYFAMSATANYASWVRDELWNQLIIIKISDVINYYMNGILLESDSLGSAAETFTFNLIGADTGIWKGDLAEIAFYNHILTPSEISELYRDFLRAGSITKSIV